jgi:hypothetical protein
MTLWPVPSRDGIIQQQQAYRCINTKNITERRELCGTHGLVNICLRVIFLFIFEYVWQRKSVENFLKGEAHQIVIMGSFYLFCFNESFLV